jgi:hypothetical protein
MERSSESSIQQFMAAGQVGEKKPYPHTPSVYGTAENKWQDQSANIGDEARVGHTIKMQDQENEEVTLLAQALAREMMGLRQEEGGSAFLRLTDIITKERLPKDETVQALYRQNTVDMMANLLADLKTTRLNMVPEQYGLMRHGGNLSFMATRLESTMAQHNEYKDLGEAENLAKVLNRDIVRFQAFETTAEHASVYQQYYYDGMYIYAALVTGRRIKVMSMDDFRKLFGKLKGLEMNLDKSLPPEIGEGSGEMLKDMTAEHLHWDMAVASLNRFNPFKEKGQETEMKIGQVEKNFIESLFKGGKTKEIEVAGKRFPTMLLSFYTTMSTEEERVKYESLMRALLIHDAYKTIKELPEYFTEFTKEQDDLYIDLFRKVQKTSQELIDGFDSFVGNPRARIARWANDTTFSLNVATLNINYLAYGYEWEPEKDNKGKEIIGTNGKPVYKNFKPSIAGPNTGFDAVNIWLHLQHETEYMLKARIRGPLNPSVNGDEAWDLIRNFVVEKGDKTLEEKILKNKGLSVGAAILDLFPGKINRKNIKNLQMTGEDFDTVDKIRGSDFGGNLKFNEKAARIMEKTMIAYPVWVKGRYLPFPLMQMNGINMLNTLVTDKQKGKTVLSVLNEGKLITDNGINFENFATHAPDAWQVNLKMLGDVMKYMYGSDPKYMSSLKEASPAESIGNLVKKLDILARTEHTWLDIGENNEDGTAKLTEIPRQYFEIVYTAYIAMSHLAFVEHGIWDGNGTWKGLDPEAFWSGGGGKYGVKQWIDAAYTTLPEKKGDFENYRDSMVLAMTAIAEWMTAIAPEADKVATKALNESSGPYSSIVDNLKTFNKK